MKVLYWLDDIRDPFKFPHSDMIKALLTDDITEQVSPAEIVWLKNYDEFITHITENGLPDILSLDHDLSWEDMIGKPSTEKTGYDCARWLVEYCMDNNKNLPGITQCHSQNPVGKKNIVTLLNNFKREQH